MTSPREVIPQPGARWLLREGGRCYAMPAALGRRLSAGEHIPGLDAALAEDRQRPGPAGGRTLWLKLPLLPGRAVARAARGLRALASWPALAILAASGGACYFATPSPAAQSLRDLDWVGMGLCLIMAGLIHELGHATALARGGGRPGRIGIGMLFVFPALYCDVTAVTLLPRRERVRVDAAGVAWHLAVGGVLALAGVERGEPTLTVASWGVLAAVVWSLLPFLRTDGYWLMCDLLGLRALEDPVPPGATGRLRAALIVWRAGYLLFLGVVAAALAGRGAWLVSASTAWRTEARVGALVGAAILGVMVVVNLVRRGVALGRGVNRSSLASAPRPPAKRAPVACSDAAAAPPRCRSS